jgi:hypothetical protein
VNRRGDKLLIVSGGKRGKAGKFPHWSFPLLVTRLNHVPCRARPGTRFPWDRENIIFVRQLISDLNCRPPQLCDRLKVPEMSSPVAEPAAPALEVKVEDSIVADSGAPDATDRVAPATSPEAGLTKKEFDMMTGILHRISNYRDEEYALYPGSFCTVSKLTN